MKIGRNAPCPCGSGKKYKKCCLDKASPPVDLLWHRLIKAQDDLINKLVAFAKRVLGEIGLVHATGEFLRWPDADEIDELIEDHMSLFTPWYLFNWVYDPDDSAVELNVPAYVTIAEMYLAENRARLDNLQVRFIETAVEIPFTYHEVIECKPGRSFTLRDAFTGAENNVLEKTASQMIMVGDLLFGRVMTVDHVSILLGCSSFSIRPLWKPSIIDLRRHIKKEFDVITDDVVEYYEGDIRDLYFSLYEAVMQPPEMVNTDGDPMEFQTLRYDIDDAETAFEKLCSLADASETCEDLRKDAVLDDHGRVVEAEIPWLRAGYKKVAGPENTVMGRLMIKGNTLEVEVNSNARAESITAEIRKRMGSSARHTGTETRTANEMWPTDTDGVRNGSMLPPEQHELMASPEVRKHLVRIFGDHWKGWMNEKIPALGGKTPRQAVKTADGRESVEALLLDARRDIEQNGLQEIFEQDPIEQVRRKLGLDRPLKTQTGRSPSTGGGEAFKNIKSMIEAFGREHYIENISDLAVKLCHRLECGEEFSLDRGRPEIWASAILYVIGQLNFLFDHEHADSLSPQDLCDDLGTNQRTVSSKALLIRRTCDIRFLDPEYSLPEIMEMLSFYESPDGELSPTSMIDDFEDAKPVHPKQLIDHATDSPREHSNPNPEGSGSNQKKQRKSKEKPSHSGGKQLNLFDEE
ncbi:MAG: DUF2384 domain-containing protein [Desulfobacteraceae bacterium]|nr:DUF2384 domain-containing protein [Desulfobacteraceae bacterium]